MRSIRLLTIFLSVSTLLEAASQISTSTGDAFWSAANFYTHHTGGHFWVAFHDGDEPVIFSSPDGATWTSRGVLFQTFMPADDGRWAVRYFGNTLIAFAYNSADTNRYYTKLVLNNDGTVTPTTADLPVTGVSGTAHQPLNALIINGKPVMWRAGLTNADNGRFTFGSALDSPITWTDTGDAPALSAVTAGAYGGGAIFPTGGADPDDLIVLRATTLTVDTPGAHRLVSIKYDAGGAGFDPAWYNVSLRGGLESESNTTEVDNTTEADIQRRFTAVTDTSGNLHAIYMNDSSNPVHYKKNVGFNDDWTIVSTDVTQFGGGGIGKLSLSAAANDNLYLYYEKNDNSAYYRRFDGTAWGPENFIITTPDLRQALAPLESSVGCTQALAWFQNSSLPWEVMFSLDAAPCSQLAVTESGARVTVTAAGSYEMVLDQAFGGSIVEFYDLSEDPGRSIDLAGGASALNGLLLNGMTVNPGPLAYANDSNDATAQRAKLDVIEVTGTRVKLRQEAFYEEQNGGNNIVPGIKSVNDYTIHPSGKAAVKRDRQATAAVTTLNHGMAGIVVHTDPLDVTVVTNWGFFTDGGGTAGSPYTGDQTFSLARIDQVGAKTDFLDIIYENFGAANELGFFDGNPSAEEWAGWSYSDPNGTTYPAGTSETFNFLLYFKPTNFGDNTDLGVLGRRDDYRGPYNLALSFGQAWIDAAENTPNSNDKFNESEGAYLIDFDTTNGIRFDINGLSPNRFSPTFKLRQYRSLMKPQSLLLDGVTKSLDLDFRADVKPVARAFFTDDLMWHSTLESSGAVTSPDVGNPGIVGPNVTGPVAGRYGNGIHVPDDINSYIEFPRDFNFNAAKGAIEFWHRPDYPSNDGVSHSLGGYNFNGTNFWRFEKDNTNALRFEIRNGTAGSQIGVPATQYGWQVGDWVHFRFEWDDSLSIANQLKIFVNGVERNPGGGTGDDYTASTNISTNIRIGRRNPDPNGSPGIYDELYVYGGPNVTTTALAHGGLTSNASEYLADNGKNFPLAFRPLDGSSRGEYVYFGADSKFRGLNVLLDVQGAGASPTLQWEYWNGSAWTVFAVTDETAAFTQRAGTIHWAGDPFQWSLYSMSGGPELYYVRAHLLSGSYSTDPVERLIKTDILLLQYCGDITADNETFELAAPLATAVELTSFQASSRDGFVELTWETASEIDNLGFDLYRSQTTDDGFERITSSPLPGLGSSPEGARYHYRDDEVVAGATYYYELADIDASGETTRHGPVEVTVGLEGESGGSEGSTPEEPAQLTYGDPHASGIRVVRTTPRGVVLELSTPGFYAYAVESGEGSVRIEVPGFDVLAEEATPMLPVKRHSLEAVAGRDVTIQSVRAFELERFSGLRPASSVIDILANRRGSVRAAQFGRGPSLDESLEPARWAQLESVGYQAGTKKALVRMSPFRWDAASAELVLAKRLRVQVSFAKAEPHNVRRAAARGGRTSTRGSKTIARLVTEPAGLYAVAFEDVFGRGRPVDTASLKLSRLGRTTAFHVEPDPNVFGPGSVLYFYTEGASLNPYGHEAVYELERGVPGERMAVVDATPRGGERVSHYRHTVRREVDRHYQPALLTAPDPWLWEILFAPAVREHTFVVQDLALAGETPRLTIWMQGASDTGADPDHHVRFAVNGVLIHETFWRGKEPHRVSAAVPSSILHDGENVLTIDNVGDTEAPYSMVLLDRFELSYARRLAAGSGELDGTFPAPGTARVSGVGRGTRLVDVTGPGLSWLTGAVVSRDGIRFAAEADRRYYLAAPSAIQTPEVRPGPKGLLTRASPGADYVVIAPGAFVPAVEPLVERRRSQGLVVATIELETIYDELGHGERRPEAIRELIAHAYHVWSRPPRYILLVGDGTYDFKDNLGAAVDNLLPPFMVKTRTLRTASDPTYAMVDGSDPLPDVAVGRLPVSTIDELQAIVSKILAFESAGTSLRGGPAVLVADHPDRAGDFVRDADELAHSVLATREVRKIYLNAHSVEDARHAIDEAFGDGPALMSYLGHGGIHLWSNTSVLDTTRVPDLPGASRHPVLLTMNCLNGYFHFPYFDSLAEELLEADGRGVVAALAPSGLSFNDAAHRYHKALLAELSNDKNARLGDAILAAQASYAELGADWSLLQIYNLLGDPALTLR